MMSWAGVLDIFSAVHTGASTATLSNKAQWPVAEGTTRAWSWSAESIDTLTFMHCRQWPIEVLRSNPGNHRDDNHTEPIIVPEAIAEPPGLDRRSAIINAARRAGVPAAVIGRHLEGAAFLAVNASRNPGEINESHQLRISSAIMAAQGFAPGLPVLLVCDPRLSDASGWLTGTQVGEITAYAKAQAQVGGLCWRAIASNGWTNLADVEASAPDADERSHMFALVNRYGSGDERQPVYVRVGSLRGELPNINSGLSPLQPIMPPVGNRAGRWTRDIIETVHTASLNGGTGIEVIKMAWAGFNPTIVAALKAGAVNQYRLDEASGNAVDSKGSSPLVLTGTIGSTTGVDGVNGARRSASETAGRLQAASSLVTYASPWCIAMWLRPTSLPAEAAIAGQYNTFAGGQWGLLSNNDDLSLFAITDVGLRIATVIDVLEAGKWTLAVASYTAAGKWTLRAAKASSAPTVAGGAQNASGVVPGSPSTPAFSIFNGTGSLVQGWIGDIDEVIVFNNEPAAFGSSEDAVLEQLWGGGAGIDFAALDAPLAGSGVARTSGLGVSRVRIGL